jgi:hypothetical protein
MACGDSNPGYRSTPRGTPGPYVRKPGGYSKWPMVRALVVVAMATSGMAARHNSQPLGNRSGSGCA